MNATQRAVDEAILAAILNHPRSLQTAIGPSQVGTPCDRRLYFTLTEQRKVRPVTDQAVPGALAIPWRPTIGTAAHAWVESKLPSDFLRETEVYVGDVLGRRISGHADAFHIPTLTVLDWKFVGPTSIRNYRANGPGQGYRTQTHLYGRGFHLKGIRPRAVAIYFFAVAGEWRDRFYWEEPYNEAIAVQALQHAEHVEIIGNAAGADALPVADDYCQHCPWFVRGTTETWRACPGAPDRQEKRDQIYELLPPSRREKA